MLCGEKLILLAYLKTVKLKQICLILGGPLPNQVDVATSPQSHVELKNTKATINEKHGGIVNIVKTKKKSMEIQRMDIRKLNRTKKDIAKEPPNVAVKEPLAVPSHNQSSGSITPLQPQKDRGQSDEPRVGRG